MPKAIDRISTLDTGYQSGDLSVYPAAKDTVEELYEVRNNAETSLTQTLGYGARYLVVGDTSAFPPKGLILVGFEIIYYDKKTSTTFQDLKRGFAGSRQGPWPVGTPVRNSVMAEPHNALKDALINIQKNIGLSEEPTTTSLHGILKRMELRYLSPKPIFRAYPTKGASPLTVKFQNFSTSSPARYLWDFGDGETSVEEAPVHTYLVEGEYTVKLNMITSLGGQGVVTKDAYVTVDDDLQDGFYYITPAAGTTSTTFTFVDQTPGDVISRYWIFDDGDTVTELDPDVHTTTHVYDAAGTYETSLVVVFADQTLRRYVTDEIVVN